jgi:Sulfotransferase domain
MVERLSAEPTSAGLNPKAVPPELLPNFVILGAQKSASTFVHRCLEEHPEVYIPEQEIRFFENPEYLESTLDTLTGLFKNVPLKPLRGIKRPDYLGKPEVPERIKTLLPGAKLIAVLRNPVDRLLSAYFYYIKLGFLPVKPLDEGLRAILARNVTGYPRAYDLVEYGFYHKHVTRYVQLFPREQLLLLLHDDIQKQPLESMKQVYAFLGVDETYAPKGLERRENSGLYSLPRLRFLGQRNRLLFRYNDDRTRLYRNKLSPLNYLGVGAITVIDKMILARLYGNDKPKLSEDLKRELYTLYRDDISALEGLLGKSLEKWKLS